MSDNPSLYGTKKKASSKTQDLNTKPLGLRTEGPVYDKGGMADFDAGKFLKITGDNDGPDRKKKGPSYP